MPEDYPYLLTAGLGGRRTGRAGSPSCSSATRFGPADFAAMQADVLSLLAEDLLPIMLSGARRRTPAAAAAKARLETWDRVMRADAAEPLIFAAWYRELSRLIYADELARAVRRLLARASAVHGADPDARGRSGATMFEPAPSRPAPSWRPMHWMRRSLDLTPPVRRRSGRLALG